MANGKIVYPTGAGVQLTYTFTKNYDYGHTEGYLETDDNVRGFDGTLNSYSGARKKTYELTFSFVLKAQLDIFRSIWEQGLPVDLYLDGINKDAEVRMMTPPSSASAAAFVDGVFTYSFTVTFEEV
jgi:hypothetical protein